MWVCAYMYFQRIVSFVTSVDAGASLGVSLCELLTCILAALFYSAQQKCTDSSKAMEMYCETYD